MRESWRKSGVAPKGYTAVPPDGKWGWVVLGGCIIVGYVGVSIGIVFSVIMDDLIREFHTNTATISWITAVLSGVSGMLGPLCTVMVNVFSCRRTVIIGALLCFTGLVASSYAKSFQVLLLTFGIMTGTGCCLIFVPLQVILASYFRKYYGIAMGILTSGYATSKVTATPIIQLLSNYYGWRGTMLIIGGFMLNALIGGALFQPHKWHAVLVPNAPTTDLNSNPEKPVTDENLKATEEEKVANEDGLASRTEFKVELEKQLYKRMPLLRPTSVTESKDGDAATALKIRPRRFSSVSGSALELNGPLSNEVLKIAAEDDESSDDETENKAGRSFKDKLLHSIDFTLFREPLFYVIVTHYSLLLATMTYSTVFLYPFGVGAGLEPMEAAGLVSARSIGEIIGRTAGPVTLVALKIPTLPAFITCISLSAAVFIIQSYMTTLLSLYAVSALSGTIFGASVGMNSLILLEIMGIKRLPSVIGLCTFFQGFVVLGLGPIIGWARDATGTYATCIVFLAGLQMLIALTWILKLLNDRRTSSPSNKI